MSNDGLIADVEPLNKKVLSKAKNLKIISRVGIGTNNIDLRCAKKKGIVVTNTPDAPTEAVIELNFLDKNVLSKSQVADPLIGCLFTPDIVDTRAKR